MSGPSPTATSVEGLAIPKDDTTPDAPVVPLAQGDLETDHPHRATGAHLLCLRQFRRAIREKPLVFPLGPTSSVFLYLLQILTHVESSIFRMAMKKAAGVIGGLLKGSDVVDYIMDSGVARGQWWQRRSPEQRARRSIDHSGSRC